MQMKALNYFSDSMVVREEGICVMELYIAAPCVIIRVHIRKGDFPREGSKLGMILG